MKLVAASKPNWKAEGSWSKLESSLFVEVRVSRVK